MNPKSLITAGLIAVGLASAAHANTIVTLTGSTAFRAVVYTACKSPGVVFASAASGAPADPKVVSATDANSANDIVYEGYIQNPDTTYTLYDLVCEFTGSEAGIASVSGLSTLANDTPFGNNGPHSPIPGVPPTYLTQASSWLTKGAAGNIPTDLSFADTSQAVSLTKKVSGTGTDLVGYGVVGIVPFMWMKGKNSAPTTPSWGHLVNLTHPAAHLALSGAQVPRLFTGNTNDPDTDTVIVIGRNKGSGTRVNQLLDCAYGLTVQVDQYAINSTYTGNGVLTQNGVIAYTDANIFEVGNDGFDSGGSVGSCLKCDGKGSTFIPIGFLGISDAIGLPIHTGGAASGGAVVLTLDGVTESNGAVENAQYTAWGHENLYGKHGQLTTDAGGIVGAHLFTGVPATLVTLGWGVTNNVQDIGIPVSLMHADKSGDVGYPFTE